MSLINRSSLFSSVVTPASIREIGNHLRGDSMNKMAIKDKIIEFCSCCIAPLLPPPATLCVRFASSVCAIAFVIKINDKYEHSK